MFLTHFLAPKPFMTQLLESSRGIHWLPMLQEHRQCDFRSISGFLQILVIQTAVLSPNYDRYRSQMHEFGVLASERTHLCLFRMSGMTLRLSQLLKGQQGVFLTKTCGFWTIPTVWSSKFPSNIHLESTEIRYFYILACQWCHGAALEPFALSKLLSIRCKVRQCF